jgi:hypothetical protein
MMNCLNGKILVKTQNYLMKIRYNPKTSTNGKFFINFDEIRDLID